LQQQSLYLYTVNGFPYGTFHGQAVKEKVYQPDWAMPDRLEYSRQLARILGVLLPEGQHGSISTVPVGFKPDYGNPQQLNGAVDNLLRLAAFLAELEHDDGKLVQFALEPEPGCYLETTRDTVAFFQQQLFTDNAVEQLALYLPSELKPKAGVSLLKRHLGVCLDTCHAAVMFESPLAMNNTLLEAGIPVHKIQLTAALHIRQLTTTARERLRCFADAIYLHQTSVRTDDGNRFYLDLEPALDDVEDGVELRSHFHVPVFAETLGELGTTQEDLRELLADIRRKPGCPHLEVETYTFDVLPAELKQGSVADNISRELNWVKEQLAR
ncbi:MAG TPA: metabolite traffic protein EboE, partial [Gammaproteobacteria bacterium]